MTPGGAGCGDEERVTAAFRRWLTACNWIVEPTSGDGADVIGFAVASS